jgi:putative transposase
VSKENYQVYGADKVWLELNRQGIAVARCTTERLMRGLGLQDVRRGRKVRTAVRASGTNGQVTCSAVTSPSRPPTSLVADFTHVTTCAGVVYVAFIADIYSRTIVGWAAATSAAPSSSAIRL